MYLYTHTQTVHAYVHKGANRTGPLCCAPDTNARLQVISSSINSNKHMNYAFLPTLPWPGRHAALRLQTLRLCGWRTRPPVREYRLCAVAAPADGPSGEGGRAALRPRQHLLPFAERLAHAAPFPDRLSVLFRFVPDSSRNLLAML